MRKMNDPHVVALIYRIEHDDSVDYSEAPPLEHEEVSFHVSLENKTVCFRFKDHHATEREARTPIEVYIRSWEFEAALSGRPGQFRLRFERAQIVDRNPPPPTPGVVNLSFSARAGLPTVRVSATATAPKPYPPPPSGVTLDPYDPNVLTMYWRFKNHVEGKEPLAGMAYFCLTMLEKLLSKNRIEAARKYGISHQVLKKIGDLVTNKGGPEAARKASGVGNKLTSEESRFLEEAVKTIILRVAKVAHNPCQQLRKITVSDLPQLPK